VIRGNERRSIVLAPLERRSMRNKELTEALTDDFRKDLEQASLIRVGAESVDWHVPGDIGTTVIGATIGCPPVNIAGVRIR